MSGFKVKIFTNEGSQTMSVAKSHLLIGSADHCDVQLAGGEIAGEHLRIWSDEGHLWGQDLGTPRGTSLNGQALQSMRPVMFHEADLFRLGTSDATLAFHATTMGTVRAPVVNKPPEISPETLEQIQSLQAHNQLLQDELNDLRAEQTQKVLVVDAEEEEEISQVKHSALQEIQAMKEAESRRFEIWKREAVEELEPLLAKVVRNNDRKKSADDLCLDLSNVLRVTLLGDEKAVVRRRRRSSEGRTRTILAAFILCLLAAASFFYVKRTPHRMPSSVVYVPPPSKQATEGRALQSGSVKNSNK